MFQNLHSPLLMMGGFNNLIENMSQDIIRKQGMGHHNSQMYQRNHNGEVYLEQVSINQFVQTQEVDSPFLMLSCDHLVTNIEKLKEVPDQDQSTCEYNLAFQMRDI